MKKWIALFLALLLVSSLSLTALAAEDTLSLSDASGQEGDIVYLAVSLNEPIRGNTIGITYSYDAALLQAQPDYCSWSIAGLMKDFDSNNAGVWASGNTQDLSGTICVLAFQLKAPLTEGTAVSCTMIIKDSSTTMGTFTAQATVSTTCDHQYSNWSDNGAIGHHRVCTLCNAPQTQSHTWDEGVLSDNPDNPFSQLKTYTCSVCAGTKSVEVFVQKEEEQFTQPTFPQQTTPTTHPTDPTYATDPLRPTTPSNNKDQNKPTTATKPVSGSTGSQQQATQPTYRDYNQPTETTQGQQEYHVHADGSIHYGDHEDTASVTVTAPATTGSSDTDSHNHTHETQAQISKQARQSNMILSVVVVCLMFAAGALYLRKKKK